MPVLESSNQIAESTLADLSRSLGPKLDLAMAIQKQLTIDLAPILEAQNHRPRPLSFYVDVGFLRRNP